jgi:hypothetical protein
MRSTVLLVRQVPRATVRVRLFIIFPTVVGRTVTAVPTNT